MLDLRVSTSAFLTDADKKKLTTPISEEQLPEPYVIAQAVCKQDEIVLSTGASFTKSGFSTMVVFFDIFSMIILVIFTRWLERRQIDYAEEFEDQTIQMNKFCLRFENLPANIFFEGKEEVLRA